jgi:glutamate transport system permease protein
VPTYLIVATVYIGLCGLLSALAFWLQRRLSRTAHTAARPFGADAASEVDQTTTL